MPVIATSADHIPVGHYSTDEDIAEYLWVKGGSNISQRWLLRLNHADMVAEPGDVFYVEARSRITSEHNYNIGVGSHLHVFDVDGGGSAGQWWRISPYAGDNVNLARHHMPLHCTAVWQVPEDWPAGHHPAFVYLGDAHSTAWQSSHKIAVDHGYGLMTATRWHDPS